MNLKNMQLNGRKTNIKIQYFWITFVFFDLDFWIYPDKRQKVYNYLKNKLNYDRIEMEVIDLKS